MNEPLDPKVALAYASIAAGIGCIAAGILMNNPSTLAVGAGLLGAPGVAKGVGGESVPEQAGDVSPPSDDTVGLDPALVEAPVGEEPMSADEAAGGSGYANPDVTAEFDEATALQFEEE
jgi:hypothetical protein